MNIVQLFRFLANPQDHVGDARNLIVATYNLIEGQAEGVTDFTTKGSRRLKVVVGGAMFRGESLGFFNLPDPRADLIESTKATGVEAVAGVLSETSEGTFVVLYVGTSRLGEMTNLAASLVKRGAKVALLACGCDGPTMFSFADDSGEDDIILLWPSHPGRCDSEYVNLGIVVERLLEL